MTTYSAQQTCFLTELNPVALQQWSERGLIDFMTEHTGDRSYRRFTPAHVDLIAIMSYLHRAGFSPAVCRALADRIIGAVPDMKLMDHDGKAKLPRVAITLREMRPQTASSADVEVAVVENDRSVSAYSAITLVINLQTVKEHLCSAIALCGVTMTGLFEQIEEKVQAFVESQGKAAEKAAESACTRSKKCA